MFQKSEGPKSRTGVPTEGRHTNLAAHTTLWAQPKGEQITRGTECRQREDTRARKPPGTEGGHADPKPVHTSPPAQRPARGAETSARQLLDAEGELRGPRDVHTSLCDAGGSTQAPT